MDASTLVAVIDLTDVARVAMYAAGIVAALALIPLLSGMRYIPHNRIGIVEKMWSAAGSLAEGRMIVVDGLNGCRPSPVSSRTVSR